jgi:hypothetical protein
MEQTFTEEELYVALFKTQLDTLAKSGKNQGQKMILIDIIYAQNISNGINKKLPTETLEEMTKVYHLEQLRCK